MFLITKFLNAKFLNTEFLIANFLTYNVPNPTKFLMLQSSLSKKWTCATFQVILDPVPDPASDPVPDQASDPASDPVPDPYFSRPSVHCTSILANSAGRRFKNY